jgi:hypothetical protein
MDDLFVKETREKEAEQISGDLGDGAFRGEIDPVKMVNASDAGIGSNEFIG